MRRRRWNNATAELLPTSLAFDAWTPEEMGRADVEGAVAHFVELARFGNQLDAYETEVFNTVVSNGLSAELAAGLGERDLAAALAKLQGISKREAKDQTTDQTRQAIKDAEAEERTETPDEQQKRLRGKRRVLPGLRYR